MSRPESRATRDLASSAQNYEDLIDVVDYELRAQLALGVLGEIHATSDQRRALAAMIADEGDWRFRLESRVPPGEDESS